MKVNSSSANVFSQVSLFTFYGVDWDINLIPNKNDIFTDNVTTYYYFFSKNISSFRLILLAIETKKNTIYYYKYHIGVQRELKSLYESHGPSFYHQLVLE